jgi:hypothetical protein
MQVAICRWHLDELLTLEPHMQAILPSKLPPVCKECNPFLLEPHNQLINQCYIRGNEIHREFMPAIRRKIPCLVVIDLFHQPKLNHDPPCI